MNSKRKIAIAASALVAFASIVLISNQASASDLAPATTPTVASQPVITGDVSDPDGIDVQSGDQTTPDVAGATSETAGETDGAAEATDGDNVQFESGDQTGPDTTDATDTVPSN